MNRMPIVGWTTDNTNSSNARFLWAKMDVGAPREISIAEAAIPTQVKTVPVLRARERSKAETDSSVGSDENPEVETGDARVNYKVGVDGPPQLRPIRPETPDNFIPTKVRTTARAKVPGSSSQDVIRHVINLAAAFETGNPDRAARLWRNRPLSMDEVYSHALAKAKKNPDFLAFLFLKHPELRASSSTRKFALSARPGTQKLLRILLRNGQFRPRHQEALKEFVLKGLQKYPESSVDENGRSVKCVDDTERYAEMAKMVVQKLPGDVQKSILFEVLAQGSSLLTEDSLKYFCSNMNNEEKGKVLFVALYFEGYDRTLVSRLISFFLNDHSFNNLAKYYDVLIRFFKDPWEVKSRLRIAGREIDKKDFVEGIKKCIERAYEQINLYFDEEAVKRYKYVRRLYKSIENDITADEKRRYLDFLGIGRHAGIRVYVNDVMHDYTTSLVMPRLICSVARREDARSKEIAAYLERSIESVEEEIFVEVVKPLIFGHLTLSDLFNFVDHWHLPHMRTLLGQSKRFAGKSWVPLFLGTDGNRTNMLPVSTHPRWTVVCLDSADALIKEGRLLEHCIGTGPYINKGLQGASHFVSIRNADGVPVSTVEYNLRSSNGRIKAKCDQHYGKGNDAPTRTEREIELWCRESIENGKIKVDFPYLQKEAEKRKMEGLGFLQVATNRYGFNPITEHSAVKDDYKKHSPFYVGGATDESMIDLRNEYVAADLIKDEKLGKVWSPGEKKVRQRELERTFDEEVKNINLNATVSSTSDDTDKIFIRAYLHEKTADKVRRVDPPIEILLNLKSVTINMRGETIEVSLLDEIAERKALRAQQKPWEKIDEAESIDVDVVKLNEALQLQFPSVETDFESTSGKVKPIRLTIAASEREMLKAFLERITVQMATRPKFELQGETTIIVTGVSCRTLLNVMNMKKNS
ncbi:MAG: hypothetical protein JWR22_1666 [Herminiimonas sp.]|nr:hypothetical protein [Herminiimonas sp.]